MTLPKKFMNIMEKLLGNEYDDFLLSYDRKYYKGIRINTIKIPAEDYVNITPFELENIPWSKEGFFIDEKIFKPGKHPHYHCGLYYIQEPSAMIPVEVLNPKPGEKILDISAAPGGKATQIGAKLNNKGILVANDISPKRVKPLAKNIQLFGITNSIITNETPENLASVFKGYFDKVLVDAPCSGEGMFKRDPKAIKRWSQKTVEKYSNIQREILKWIPKMLKPGGQLVYSTCTFSPEENEGTIEWFLKRFPEFQPMKIDNIQEIDNGKPEWIDGREDLKKTKRAWPHRIKGEGHFIALLSKKEGDEVKVKPVNYPDINVGVYNDFAKEHFDIKFTKNLKQKGTSLYMLPDNIPNLKNLKIIEEGLYLGEVLKNRFQPSQSLAMALKKEEAKNVVELSSESIQSIKYLKGETILIEGEKGWKLVCIDGFPVGWAKQIQGHLKNYYRPGWRMR